MQKLYIRNFFPAFFYTYYIYYYYFIKLIFLKYILFFNCLEHLSTNIAQCQKLYQER